MVMACTHRCWVGESKGEESGVGVRESANIPFPVAQGAEGWQEPGNEL